MKKLLILSTLTLSIFLMSGCAGKKPLFYYGDYSESYYADKKEMSADSALKLQKAIEEAIAHADESRTGKVPPGMYANLGYIYLKQGNSKMAKESFTKEKALYPESIHFMDRMIKKIDTAEGNKDEK